MKAKIPTALFQCTFLGEFVILAPALTASQRPDVSCLKATSSIRPARAKAILFETFLEQVSPTQNIEHITIHRKPRKNLSNPAIIFRVDSKLFDDCTACFLLFQNTDRSERNHLATRDEVVISRVKLFRRCSSPIKRHVVSLCCKITSPWCDFTSYRDERKSIV